MSGTPCSCKWPKSTQSSAGHYGSIAGSSNSAASFTGSSVQKRMRQPSVVGGSEAMDEKQVVKLFEVLSRLAPWAAVLMLLQLFFKNPDGDC